jgi:hypothetical protein
LTIGKVFIVYSILLDATEPQKIRDVATTKDNSGIHQISLSSVMAMIVVTKKHNRDKTIIKISTVAGIVFSL